MSFLSDFVRSIFCNSCIISVDACCGGAFYRSLELAAVGGSTGTIINLLFGFLLDFLLVRLLSLHSFTEQAIKEMVSRSVHTAIALSIAGGAILSAIGFIFCKDST